MVYRALDSRYDDMKYRRCGRSGLMLPALSLGFWHNFGGEHTYENSRAMALRAFDLGITHFDLANIYGPPRGSAEETFGRLLHNDLAPYRDELIIATKAGSPMWPGPYGNWGSRKYLVASLDQSLRRMGLDYVDIYYHHRPDPETPLEETMLALDHIVRQGKALYVGVSNYNADMTAEAIRILRELGTPLLIHQPRYSMLYRDFEQDVQKVLLDNEVGSIVYSPLAQGLLTDKYIHGMPENARANKQVTEEKLAQVRELHKLAADRGQSLSQMALAWVLREEKVTTALIGASRVSQIEDNVGALNNMTFTEAELQQIDRILGR